jgi:tRNA A-37 threonylcarbamoyl transferase component Bud32/tetratricopeptide (TPR) repeat protein
VSFYRMAVYSRGAVREACLSDEEIAGYVEHRGSASDVETIERHLDACASCRGVVVEFTRAFVRSEPASAARSMETIEDAPPTFEDPIRVVARGTKIARYVVVRELGRGGMGLVYEAYDPELDRKVAVKVLRWDRVRGDARVASVRLQREARAMARLAHPNVIIAHDVGTVDGGVFVAMELVEGTTLRGWLETAPRSLDAILAMFVAAGRGLVAAHAAGIVHRDFKPENVLVGTDGRVRVTDFGLARASERIDDEARDEAGVPPRSGRSSLTETGAMVGTPAYMSPEQVRGQEATEESDQFAFCVALWEALYGERPFAGADVKQLARAIAEGKIRAPTSRRRVPRWLHEAVVRGLGVDPASRHPSIAALLDVLESHRARTRRTWISIAALVAVAAAAIVTFAGMRSRVRPSTLCQGAGAELAGVWDDATKARVRSAFVATGAPFAIPAWSTVESALDGYARAWVEMQDESCTSTRIRGVQPDAVFDLRAACLARRKAELGALVDVLGRADRDAVENAPKAVASLTSVAACADVQALSAQTPLPDDPSVRARIDDLRARLANARALYDTGKWTGGEKAARAVLDDARAIGWRPLEAEATFAVATMTPDNAKAQTLLLDAVTSAEAGRDDEIAARSWIALVRVATRRHVYDRAEEYSQHATAALERLRGDAGLRADLTDALGQLRYELAHYDDAIALYRRELELRGDAKTEPVESCLTRLGNTLLGQEDVASARPVVEREIDLARTIFGENHPQFALACDQLARVELDEGAFDRALEDFARGERILLASTSTPLVYPPDPTDPDAELGESLAPALQVDLARRTEYLMLSTIDDSEGTTHLLRHEWDAAGDAFERARDVIEQHVSSKTQWLVGPLIGIGRVAREKGRLTDALATYERALAIAEATDSPNDPVAPAALLGIAETKLASKQPLDARASIDRALTILGDRGSHLLRGALQFALARALWDANADAANAIAAAKRAHDELAKATARATDLRAELDAWSRHHVH